MVAHSPSSSLAQEVQLEASHARSGSTFLVYKAGFSSIGDLMNFCCLPDSEKAGILLWHTEVCQVSCSENREIVSPCILITPNAFDLGSACRLNVTVSLALCSFHQAGCGCLGNGLISLSATLPHEAVTVTQLGEVCGTPRALGLRTLPGHGAPHQAPSAHRIPPHLVIGQVHEAHPFSQSLVGHWLLSQGCLQILHDPATSTWYIPSPPKY